MSGVNAIDLSRLPPPDAVQALDYETALAQMKARLIDLDPTLEPALSLESTPESLILQVCAYFRILDRNETNQAVRAVMPALARGADLDQLGVLMGLGRLVITPANPETGAPAVMESDEAFRRRFVLAPEGFSVAGPAGAYEFHALSASGDVLDASAVSPAPGEVLVTVLSRLGDGTASPELLAAVEAKVSADDIRPLTDLVTVQSAEILDFTVEATIRTFSGPDPSVVVEAAEASLEAYLASARRLSRDVPRSAVIAALHVPGVQRVDLVEPAADLVVTPTQAANCTGVVLTHGGLDD